MNGKEVIHLPHMEKDESGLSFGEVIQKYRVLAKLNQGELADLIGVTRVTVNNWENNKTKPDRQATKKMAELIGLPLYELFGVEHAPLPSHQENIMLNRYRSLSPVGQKVAFSLIVNMLKEEQEAATNVLRSTFSIIPKNSTVAAAGQGNDFADFPPEPFFFKPNRFNRSADRIIEVRGDSMLPDYHDGDYVYVEDCECANDDDIVIASYHEGLVIKRFCDGKLYSINEDLPFGEKTEDDNIRIIGKVVGIVDEDEIPTKDEKIALQDAFSDELRKFRREYGE